MHIVVGAHTHADMLEQLHAGRYKETSHALESFIRSLWASCCAISARVMLLLHIGMCEGSVPFVAMKEGLVHEQFP